MDIDRSARLALAFSEALRRRQWSVYRLSKEAGVALKTTQKIVSGLSPEPSFWSVVDLAHALELSLDTLAGPTPGAQKQPTAPRQRTGEKTP
jgi:hypothetical protein